MQADYVRAFLERLGCAHTKHSNQGWINGPCPLAPFTDKHKNKLDKHPSFGVSVNEGGKSGYRCFTCNAKGTLADLVVRLQHLATQNGGQTSGFFELLSWVQEHDKDVPVSAPTMADRVAAAAYRPHRAVEVGGIKLSEKAAKQVFGNKHFDPNAPEVFIEEHVLESMAPLSQEALEYLLKERQLLASTVTDWGLRWHPQTRRIAIPIRDYKGRLVGISGRTISPTVRPKFIHSEGYNRDRYLYGEHKLLESGSGTGIVVEGFFDAMHLWQNGYKAVAILGSYPSKMQVEKMVRFFGDIVVLPDGDTAGMDAAERVRDALKHRMPVRIAPMQKGLDPDDLSPLDLAEALGTVR